MQWCLADRFMNARKYTAGMWAMTHGCTATHSYMTLRNCTATHKFTVTHEFSVTGLCATVRS